MTMATPGSGLVHPLALLGIGVLLLNDHVLKAAMPGVITGKLSDFAGLLFFPLLLQALFEWTLLGIGAWRGPSLRVLACCALATGVCFTAIETCQSADELYRHVWSAMQTLPRAVIAFVLDRPAPRAVVVAHVMDAEDLIALPALAAAVWAGGRRGMK
jgi:hypothetical protein